MTPHGPFWVLTEYKVREDNGRRSDLTSCSNICRMKRRPSFQYNNNMLMQPALPAPNVSAQRFETSANRHEYTSKQNSLEEKYLIPRLALEYLEYTSCPILRLSMQSPTPICPPKSIPSPDTLAGSKLPSSVSLPLLQGLC